MAECKLVHELPDILRDLLVSRDAHTGMEKSYRYAAPDLLLHTRLS